MPADRLEHVLDRDVATLVGARQNRAAVEVDRREVQASHRHQHPRFGLVATRDPDKAVEPPGDSRSDLWFYYHLGRIIREKLAGSSDPKDRPILELTWDYPTEGEHDDPSADAVLREVVRLARSRDVEDRARSGSRRVRRYRVQAAGARAAVLPDAVRRTPFQPAPRDDPTRLPGLAVLPRPGSRRRRWRSPTRSGRSCVAT